MRYEITGLKAAYEGASIRTEADTAIAALRMAHQWAAQGIRGIIITNPKGESYSLDRFGMIASAKEENSSDAGRLKARDESAASMS